MRPLIPTDALLGEPPLPGDKSLSHRGLMLAALAHGTSTLHGLAPGEDVAQTLACLRALGVVIDLDPNPDGPGATARVHGRGPWALVAPTEPLQCGNSGTTMRLLMGLLAGLGLPARLVGDASLGARPMARIAEPLRAMGARIVLADGNRAPVQVLATGKLKGISHNLTVASGQLKGALLLAGLHADGPTTLTGALTGRNHTETLLQACGAQLHAEPTKIILIPHAALQPLHWRMPGDASAAAFWLAAAQVVKHSRLRLRHVGLNPSRTGFVRALQRMGAPMQRLPDATSLADGGAPAVPREPVGDIATWRGTSLRAIDVGGAAIAPIIDELPMLIGMATLAHGTTVVRDAGELRVKETDRIAAMVDNLRRMGARIEERYDGVRVVGPQRLVGARLDSFGDHRIAMALSVMAMAARGPSQLSRAGCAAVSDPNFFATLAHLGC